jgi:hypothetical protein
LPPRAHVSDELKQIIASEPAPDLSAAKTNMPATPAEWKNLIAATSSGSLAFALSL